MIVPPVAGLAVAVIANVLKPKFATNVLSPVTVKLYVAFVDTTLPFSFQLLNTYPVLGVAVNVHV